MQSLLAGGAMPRFALAKTIAIVVLAFALLLIITLAGPGLASAQVTLTSPGGGATVSGTVPVSVTVTSGVSWVNFYVDGQNIGSSPPYTVNWDSTVLLNGQHFIKVLAMNSSGSAIGEDDEAVMVANATPAATPTPSGYYGTLPPGATLPSESTCSSTISSEPSSEAIPANTSFNETLPTASELSAFHSQPLWQNDTPASDFANVDGNFTGTTDQIIQWGSCKWGLDENAMRAEAWYETNWIQSTEADRRTDYADCHTPNWDGWNGSECYQSYGIFQAKVFDYNIWSEAHDSTAFNADFRGAYLRACINGDMNYLYSSTPESGYPTYSAASPLYRFWGCMGQWASGGWFDVGSIEYIASVQMTQAAAPWPKAATSAVAITAPSAGSAVSGAVDVVTQTTSNVLWENVYIDGQYFTSSPPDSFSWNSAGVPDGTHSISARAYDSSGAQIGSASISVTTSNGSPASITAPANGSTLKGTVTIGTQTGSNVVWENVYIDGAYLASSPPDSFSWDSVNVADGPHTIVAKAYASDGSRVGSASVSVSTANGVNVKIVSPSTGNSVSGNVTIVTQTSANSSWEDVYIDGNYLASSPPDSFSWNSANVPNGAHTISARSFDNGGAQNGSDSVSVQVGN